MEQPNRFHAIPSGKGKEKAGCITINSSSDDCGGDMDQPAVSEEEVDLLEVPKYLNSQGEEIPKQAERSAIPLPEATCQCSFCQWPKGGEYGDEAIEGDVPLEDYESHSEDAPLDWDVEDFRKEMRKLGALINFLISCKIS